MNERRVLVTGSSRGIGRAIALRLAADGWSVAVHYAREAEAARATATELGEACAGVYCADLSEPGGPAALWEQAAEFAPRALVNNAGVYLPQRFLEADEQRFEACLEATFAVNWLAPLRLARFAALEFAGSGGGKILNVASRVGFRGESGASLYAASKAALINLSRSLAVELAPQNIGVFGIAPGWVETAMARDGMERRLTEILEAIPLRRMATPADCAAAAAFLLSDEAAYLSGVVLDVNGGSYFH